MRLSIKYILLVILIVIAVAAGFIFKEYNRKAADISDVKPSVKISATDLVTLFENDEAKANQLYLGKTVQVSGAITEIINQQDSFVNVMLGDANAMHKVSCVMDKRHNASMAKYTAGQRVDIKGICTGYLLDVELTRCVIADN